MVHGRRHFLSWRHEKPCPYFPRFFLPATTFSQLTEHFAIFFSRPSGRKKHSKVRGGDLTQRCNVADQLYPTPPDSLQRGFLAFRIVGWQEVLNSCRSETGTGSKWCEQWLFHHFWIFLGCLPKHDLSFYRENGTWSWRILVDWSKPRAIRAIWENGT